MDLLLTSNLQNLLDENKKPLALKCYKQLMFQRYYITRNTNTSFVDTAQMTPTEREYIIKFIVDENKKTRETLENSKHKKD